MWATQTVFGLHEYIIHELFYFLISPRAAGVSQRRLAMVYYSKQQDKKRAEKNKTTER